MADLTPEQTQALEVFKRISESLAVPAVGKPLPADRMWLLPVLDDKVLPDHPQPPDARQAERPTAAEPAKQVGRK